MSATVLHRVSWHCPDDGNRQQWFTTANKAMKFARREKISDGCRFDMVEIPRTKVELAAWLNENFGTNNG